MYDGEKPSSSIIKVIYLRKGGGKEKRGHDSRGNYASGEKNRLLT